MSELDVHPATLAFPMLSDSALQELADDIRAKGQIEPIVLYEGKILDGRNRYRACLLAEVEPRLEEWNGRAGSPLDFMVSENVKRRHLTTSQRAMIAIDLLPFYEAEARERQGTRTDLVADLPQGQAHDGKARTAAAKAVGVGGSTVGHAKAIAENEELAAQVRQGEKTVNAAYAEVQNAKPEWKTKRQQQDAEAQKRRLVNALSEITGICHGLAALKLGLVFEATETKELDIWAKSARMSAASLRNLSLKLSEGSRNGTKE